MAQLRFSGHDGSGFPLYFNPNILFQATPDNPTPVIPTQNIGIYILASVTNSGSVPAMNATVQFWVCNPATAPTPSNSTLIGTSNVSLDVGETKTVLCVSIWVPKWINNGHECVICEVSATNDPSPAHPNTPWNIQNRHVAQHNVNIAVNTPQHTHGLLLPIAAVGLHNNSAAQVAIRPAPGDLFGPALRQFGLQDFNNATKDSMSGLIPNYIAGDPLPGGEELKRNLELEHVPPNNELAFYTLVGLPNKALSTSSAAIFLVEQHDAKGNVVGGVAVIVLGDYPSPPSSTPIKAAAALAIPASIPFRPYCTNASTEFMTPDGIFITNLGVQNINVETQNNGNSTLKGLSVYVEGVADPLISAPIIIASPSNGQALASASFKSVFSADFSKATPGETVVSFIVQQQSGASSKSIRILKKIFILGFDFDNTTKNFIISIPQGSLHIHIQTIIAPVDTPGQGSCPPPSGRHCCCNGGSESGSSGPGSNPYPFLIEKGSLQWVPNPAYPGTHGPLPFNDPWWKALFAVLCEIFALAGTVVAGLAGADATGGPKGSFDEISGLVHCCDGVEVLAATDNKLAMALFAASGASALIAELSDDADLFDRGQTQTPPNAGELTVDELVHFDLTRIDTPSLGTNFGGTIKWNYSRTLDSGRILTYSTSNDFSNIHYLKSYKVNVDGTHNDSKHYTHQYKNPLIIGAQFTKPDGSLFRGSQLYVFAVLFSDTGIKIGFELRDDGYGYLGGFPPPHGDIRNGTSNLTGSVLSMRGAVLDEETAAGHCIEPCPNIGSYVGTTTISRNRTGNWYLFVFAQDINTVLEGTEPRKAAQTIGGMVLTSQFVLGLNGKPCQLDYDAVITVV
jgi:hypothetical protein